MSVLTLGNQIAHLLVWLLVAPLLEGLARWFGARLQGRRGGSWLAPYRELGQGLAQSPSLPLGSSPLSQGAPYLSLGAVVLAAALVPWWLLPPLGKEAADGFSLLGLLFVAWLLPTLSTLDADEPGAQSEAARSLSLLVFAVPAVFLLWMSESAQHSELGAVILSANKQDTGWMAAFSLSKLLALASLAALVSASVPAENAPFNGRHLALVRYSEQVRRALLCGLVGALFLPSGLSESNEVEDLGLAFGIGLAKLVVLRVLWAALSVRTLRAPFFARARVAAFGLGAAFLAAIAAMLRGG
jgi:formate hydrogenlyase subunit 4